MTAEAERLFYRAARLSEHGKASEAIAMYYSSLALASSRTCAENLGIVLGDVGRRDEAAAAFELAVRLEPTRSESYSLLARTLYESHGATARARQHFATAIALTPARAELHYELARSDQLFGDGSHVDSFAIAQQLAHAEWRRRMGCASLDWRGGPTNWDSKSGRGRGDTVRHVRVLPEESIEPTATRRTHRTHAKNSSEDRYVYGRAAPRPYASSTWPGRAGIEWPSLHFVERRITLVELRDVWISGNDGVVSDARCHVYLPSHGHEVPLHLNLPHETLEERRRDQSVRCVLTSEL